MSRVVVAVPCFRSELRPEEETSLRWLERSLGSHKRIFVAPAGLAAELRRRHPDYAVETFDDGFFRSVDTYSKLLLDHRFYRRFVSWEFLLVYQLDCLVFEDRLEHFCDLGLDYIGAPWLRDRAHPEHGFSRVGNGGLSLRRISAALRVLGSPRQPAWRYLARLMTGRRDDLPRRSTWFGLRRRLRVARAASVGVAAYSARYSLNEDHFWSDRAALFDPSFRIADVPTGLDFAFDEAPRTAFEALGRLPFGCHGWYRRDHKFWLETVPGLAAAGEV